MSEVVLVTGATGLVGANVCHLALRGGYDVRALVRSDADAQALGHLGATPIRGDVTDQGGMRDAAKGTDVVIHCAALVGGASPERAAYEAVNVDGTRNVLDAAEAANVRRTVVLATPVIFEQGRAPLTETSPLAVDPLTTPYAATKTAAYLDAVARAEIGTDVVIVTPGGVFGPSPIVTRALAPTTLNAMLVQALSGELSSFVPLPVAWVLAEDVAAYIVAATDTRKAGEHYLAFGRPEDAVTVPKFLDRACTLAGGACSVVEAALDDDESAAKFPANLRLLAARPYAEPLFDNARTVHALGVKPRSVDDGLRATVSWLTQHGAVPAMRRG